MLSLFCDCLSFTDLINVKCKIVDVDCITTTFEYPIKDTPKEAPIKNVSLSSLPNFHCMTSEDLDNFLFEFDILCWSYDYTSNAQKLKLFLATLRGAALRWFMGLGGKTITSWDDMKQTFLGRY